MIIQFQSVRKFLIFTGTCVSFTAIAIVVWFYQITEDVSILVCGFLLTSVLFLWSILFLNYFQKKLIQFTDSLCQTLDAMMDQKECPMPDLEAETLFARISHRLERLYQTMQENRRKVEEEKTELQSLVSDISHQTKTPIANLKMLNDTLLTRSISPEMSQEFLQATGNQLNKLDFLIQALVKASRLETGVITLKKQDSPISETLITSINSILAPMEKKQIHLSVHCKDDIYVPHDCRWTSEALFNLLDNAVKYTPAFGSIDISVDDWEMYVKINVADSGPGIPESRHATIFKRFYREDTVHEIDGIGIGLYLAREIITMQGGYIKIVSEVGKGSTFSVFLPKKILV